ncbi:alpha/beta fold hydrolase [Sphingopyxis sp. JAI108]|uniref:alpha/beta fold hydrolase n=1 Tax=Sphingopyxis sp. JAI108 TaxID=2723060 RepID=UPI0015C912BD|nr:alpha/beta hydrolase [Sphingopyxis sp. JAI108]NYF30679.1 pimeloyl-ACP methyl ester carboxylesterase [Sphingopyxis sp. JAI108]
MQILLVPGFMLDAEMWSDVRPALARFGHLVDVDTARDISIGAMAERATGSLTGPAIVIGFSMGGYVAREITYRAPDRIRGLALVATSSRSNTPQPATPVGRTGFRELSRSAVVRSLHPDHRSDELIARVQRMSSRLGGEVFERQSRLRRDDDTERLREIACPTLVVAAAQDELRSIEESRTLHDQIPGSAMTIIEQSGHLIPLEQPARLISAFSAAFEELLSPGN